MKVCIYWKTKSSSIINKIRQKFGIPKGMTINGETELPNDFNTEDPIFRETERRGFFDLRHKP